MGSLWLGKSVQYKRTSTLQVGIDRGAQEPLPTTVPFAFASWHQLALAPQLLGSFFARQPVLHHGLKQRLHNHRKIAIFHQISGILNVETPRLELVGPQPCQSKRNSEVVFKEVKPGVNQSVSDTHLVSLQMKVWE